METTDLVDELMSLPATAPVLVVTGRGTVFRVVDVKWDNNLSANVLSVTDWDPA